MTMNTYEEMAKSIGYSNLIDSVAKTLGMFIGNYETLLLNNI